jgi:hypothetical protein
MLWVRISIRARCTTLCDKVCQWLATGGWFSPGPPVSSTNKTDLYDITEILLKVTLHHQTKTNATKLTYFNVFGKTLTGIISMIQINLSIGKHPTFYFRLQRGSSFASREDPGNNVV